MTHEDRSVDAASGESGFALVTVIWGTAIISLIPLAFVVDLRAETFGVPLSRPLQGGEIIPPEIMRQSAAGICVNLPPEHDFMKDAYWLTSDHGARWTSYPDLSVLSRKT